VVDGRGAGQQVATAGDGGVVQRQGPARQQAEIAARLDPGRLDDRGVQVVDLAEIATPELPHCPKSPRFTSSFELAIV
jgi:hypothetical protein